MSEAPETMYYLIPREVFGTGIADANTFNAAMDTVDHVLNTLAISAGDIHWKAPVSNFAALPGVGNLTDDVRVTSDTGDLWRWNGSSWVTLLIGFLSYQGVWDAATNTPVLSDGTGAKGYYHVVSVGGSQDLGSGSIDFSVGDWAVHNGSIWQKADHTDAVTSIFGRQGAVVAQIDDYAASQIANDSLATGAHVDDVLNNMPSLITIGSTGRLTFDGITKTGGRGITVGAGTGLVREGPPTDLPPAVIIPVTWVSTPLTVPANTTRYIEVDKTGTVALNPVFPDVEKKIFLGTVIANGTDIILLCHVDIDLIQKVADGFSYLHDTVGALVISGCFATINASPLKIDVDSGAYYVAMDRKSKPADAPITFRYWLRDGSGGWTTVNGLADVDPDFYDSDAGSPTALPAGKWKKDLLYFVPDSNTTAEYHIIYGQEVFDNKIDAVNGNIPNPPPEFSACAIRCAGVVIQEGTTAIDEILDYLPRIGSGDPPHADVTDHGMLSGLSHDDHLQYLLVGGTRAMSGDLDMGTNAVTNVGLVDGVDVSAHAVRHENGSADEISIVGLSGLTADPQLPIAPQEATATATTTTTGGADGLLAGMTLTPGAGNYMVWFSASVDHTAANGSIWVSLYVNGVQVPDTERLFRRGGAAADNGGLLSFNKYVPGVGAGQVVEVRWRTTGATANAYQRTLTLMKVA